MMTEIVIIGGMMEFKVVLEKDPEDGGYVVRCPASPGCFSQGKTKKEALKNIREAIEAYLQSILKEKLSLKKLSLPNHM